MPRLLSTISIAFASSLLILFPQFNAGGRSSQNQNERITSVSVTGRADSSLVIDAAIEQIYDSIQLQKFGLNKQAFIYAYKGYHRLLEKGYINKEGIITICDFSQSSKRKRLYLIDLDHYRLLMNTHVAHGRNSGGEYARKFSNRPQSRQSSLGFYVTKQTYLGGHGLALTIDGVEKGINDKAKQRRIVVHGSKYVGDNYLQFSNYIGRSFGCPAIPQKYTSALINTIKNGSCLFIYHPNKNYLSGSKILNG